jgi:hypothetical protein
MTLPSVTGVLSADDVRATAASIVAVQEPSGAIPWSPGEHVDIWNHVEAAMGLLVGGEVAAAERALVWVPTMQRPDGSWPMKIVNGEVEDARGETNCSAYFAVGLWHHWLIRKDRAFLEDQWNSVRRGLNWVVSLQVPFGGIQWTPVDEFCLLTASSSVYQSLRAGIALAELIGDPQPEWELAAGRLGHAVRHHRELFADKSRFSMDWYYPVLGGAVRGREGLDLLDPRWTDFVRPGYGVHCVDDNPWVTGAETCELAMVLDALDDHARARAVYADMQRLRHESAPTGRASCTAIRTRATSSGRSSRRRTPRPPSSWPPTLWAAPSAPPRRAQGSCGAIRCRPSRIWPSTVTASCELAEPAQSVAAAPEHAHRAQRFDFIEQARFQRG